MLQWMECHCRESSTYLSGFTTDCLVRLSLLSFLGCLLGALLGHLLAQLVQLLLFLLLRQRFDLKDSISQSRRQMRRKGILYLFGRFFELIVATLLCMEICQCCILEYLRTHSAFDTLCAFIK